MHVRKLVNGGIVRGDWLNYSPSTDKVFYYRCKLFGYNADSSSEFGNQFTTGFDDWKNESLLIIRHEKSKNRVAALSMMSQGNKSIRNDAELQKENEKCLFFFN